MGCKGVKQIFPEIYRIYMFTIELHVLYVFIHVSSPSSTWPKWPRRCLKGGSLNRRHVGYLHHANSLFIQFWSICQGVRPIS